MLAALHPVKEDIGKLAQGTSHNAGADLSIIHFIPLAISCLYETEVMSAVATPPSVHQHGIEHINQGSCPLLRQVVLHVKALRILHLLSHFVACQV